MADVRRRDWTAEEYFADASTSRSDLALFAESGAAHFKAVADGEIIRPASAAMRLGTFVHTAVLEPERWAQKCDELSAKIVEREHFEGKGAKAREAEWLAALPADSIVCTPTQRASLLADRVTANRMSRSLATRTTRAAALARDIIAMSEREVTYTWTDMGGDLAMPMQMRARLDLLHMADDGPIIVDLKTTTDPEPWAFARSAAKYQYPWQAAVYGAPLLEETGIEARFGFITIRSAPPYEVAIGWLSPDDIRLAQLQVRVAMRALSRCMLTDDWTSAWEQDTGHLIELPSYWRTL